MCGCNHENLWRAIGLFVILFATVSQGKSLRSVDMLGQSSTADADVDWLIFLRFGTSAIYCDAWPIDSGPVRLRMAEGALLTNDNDWFFQQRRKLGHRTSDGIRMNWKSTVPKD